VNRRWSPLGCACLLLFAACHHQGPAVGDEAVKRAVIGEFEAIKALDARTVFDLETKQCQRFISEPEIRKGMSVFRHSTFRDSRGWTLRFDAVDVDGKDPPSAEVTTTFLNRSGDEVLWKDVPGPESWVRESGEWKHDCDSE